MKKETKKTEPIRGYELGGLLSGEETFKLKFGFLNLTLRTLTAEDVKKAEQISRLPGGTRKHPKRDEDKYAESMLGSCVIAWEHIDGGVLMNGGKELDCTPKNLVMVADKMAGLAQFIFQNCSSADRMYRTLEGQEIKN